MTEPGNVSVCPTRGSTSPSTGADGTTCGAGPVAVPQEMREHECGQERDQGFRVIRHAERFPHDPVLRISERVANTVPARAHVFSVARNQCTFRSPRSQVICLFAYALVRRRVSEIA